MPPKRRKAKVPADLSRCHNSEKVVTMNLLGNFVVQGSRGEKLIEEILGTSLKDVSRNGLIRVAMIVSKLIQQKFPRNFGRRKDLIVKWFQDNEELINNVKQFVTIRYANNKFIRPSCESNIENSG